MAAEVPTWAQYMEEMTNSKFLMTCVSDKELYEDIGGMYFSCWNCTCPANPEIRVLVCAFQNQEVKFAETFTPGVTYTVQKAAVVEDWGQGPGDLGDFGCDMFVILLPKSKVSKTTASNKKGAVTLESLVRKAQRPVFKSTIVNYTELDRDWDPDSPSFLIRMRNIEGGKLTDREVHCEGEELVKTDYPVLVEHVKEEFCFTGGRISIEYTLKSFHYEMKGSDVRLKLIGPPPNAKELKLQPEDD